MKQRTLQGVLHAVEVLLPLLEQRRLRKTAQKIHEVRRQEAHVKLQ
jgi:hypothetical protein